MIKTILVHLDSAPRCAARVAIAARLAREFGAHLRGLAPTGAADVVVSVNSAVPDGLEYIQLSALYLRGRAEANADAFRARLAAPASPSSEACVVEDEPLDAVVRPGRCADLVVIGQSDRSTFIENVAWDFPQQVLMHVGRPVLVVPYAGEFASVGSRVLVAWNGSREAAIAVRDALPLLRRAGRVDLLAIGLAYAGGDDAGGGLDDVRGWLARHGVEARALSAPAGGEVGDILLSRAADLGSDLIVMGAYGHSRLREWVLGGATKALLEQMTVPVLMSH